MRRITALFVLLLGIVVAVPAQATIISVAALPVSSAGTPAAIIPAPTFALDAVAINTGMEGFDENQSFPTTIPHTTDSGWVIPAGTTVNSHMIFLNRTGTLPLSHGGVVWTFRYPIIGVMSDVGGTLEAFSSELGNPGTTYPGAFPFRGLESDDSYTVSGNTITVSMNVTEPGDWIRVVTAPEPSTILLLGLGLVGLAIGLRKRGKKS